MESNIQGPDRPMGMKVQDQLNAGIETRQVAARIFRASLDERRTLDELFDHDDAAGRFEPRDRAFLNNLLRTTFRHLGEIEAIKSNHLSKPLPRKSGSAGDILTLAIAQLLFLDTPAHAAIDSAVRMARADRNATHFSGLINAVLRKAASAGKSALDGLDSPRINTPDWLWKLWLSSYGQQAAEAVAASHMLEPALDIAVKSDAAEWAEKLGGTLLPTGHIRLNHRGLVSTLPGFDAGEWWVQDAAAGMPVMLLDDMRGRTVLDLCAAPGGKTMQLAAAGAVVTAVDVSAVRLGRLRDNLERTGLTATIIESDVLAFGMTERFDAVVLDAPCSATGTIRRHPELPYIRQPSHMTGLCATQRMMLAEAADRVTPGGSLVYCTCSLESEEGEKQIAWFQKAYPHFSLVPAGPRIPESLKSDSGWLRLLPSMTIGNCAGMDGFFMARLDRAR